MLKYPQIQLLSRCLSTGAQPWRQTNTSNYICFSKFSNYIVMDIYGLYIEQLIHTDCHCFIMSWTYMFCIGVYWNSYSTLAAICWLPLYGCLLKRTKVCIFFFASSYVLIKSSLSICENVTFCNKVCIYLHWIYVSSAWCLYSSKIHNTCSHRCFISSALLEIAAFRILPPSRASWRTVNYSDLSVWCRHACLNFIRLPMDALATSFYTHELLLSSELKAAAPHYLIL
jgi:hypothetical protein